jgi:hypothetical protein
MKKYLILIVLLAWASYAQAGGVLMMGGGTPVAAGGTGVIGQIGHDGTHNVTINNDYLVFSPYTTTIAGSVSYCHVYLVNGNGGKITTSIHNSSTGAQLAYGESGTIGNDAAQWVNVTLAAPFTLVTATSYWLGVQGNTATDIDNLEGLAEFYYHEQTYATQPGTITNDGTISSNGLSMICNNTAGSPE